MELVVMDPSCSKYLFLFPGFSTTTAGYDSTLNILAHSSSRWVSSHMNLNWLPLLIFLSYSELASFKASKYVFSGFLVSRIITHKAPSTYSDY